MLLTEILKSVESGWEPHNQGPSGSKITNITQIFIFIDLFGKKGNVDFFNLPD